MKSKKHVGTRIKEARNLLGISAEEMMKQLNQYGIDLDASVIYRYEHGNVTKFPIAYVEPFAKVLKVSNEYIMGWETMEEMLKRQSLGDIVGDTCFLRVVEMKGVEKELLEKPPIGIVKYQGDPNNYIALQLIDHHLFPMAIKKDIVIVDKKQEEFIRDSLYLLFLKKNHEYVLRKLNQDESCYLLEAYDLSKRVDRVSKDDVIIIGKVVELRRLF